MGKALLIIVMGFSIIFSGVMLNISANHQRSARAISVQYEKWIARNASESVTNVAISKIYQNPGALVTDTLSFGGASVTIATQDVTGDSITHAKTDSITIIATHHDETDTTAVKLIQPAFSYYYYFSNQWPASLTYSDGDTIKWAIHSNEPVAVSGSPVFFGNVSSYDSAGFSPAGQTPKFYGGAEFGTQNLWPPDITGISSVAGGSVLPIASDLWIIFFSDGTCRYRSSGWPSILNPGNLITLSNYDIIKTTGLYDIHAIGTVNGKVTLLSGRDLYIGNNGTSGIPGDLTYLSTNLSSNDYLGLIANNDVIIDVGNLATGIHIDASIIALQRLRIQNSPLLANLYILGSVTLNSDEAFQFGLTRTHDYDARLRENTPPYFPRLANRIEQIYRSN